MMTWKKKLAMLSVDVFIHVPGYILVNHWVASRGISYDLTLPWDLQIPYISYFSPFYALVYVLPVLCFILIFKDDELLKRAFWAFFASGSICLLLFVLIPVEFIWRTQLPLDASGGLTADTGLFDYLTYFFYQVDNPPFNCFPSMHVAGAFLSARMMKLYRVSWGPFFYFLAIMITLSTLFIRQHFILDVLGGYLLYRVVSVIFFPKSFRREHYVWLPWSFKIFVKENV